MWYVGVLQASDMVMLRAKGSVNVSHVDGIEDFCDEGGQAAVMGYGCWS